MAPIDGAIGMKININHPQTTDVNISKAQPSKASGLGGVRGLRSKSAPILYKYRYSYKKIIVYRKAETIFLRKYGAETDDTRISGLIPRLTL